MGYCVYIDLGDGDFIKPNFDKPPTEEMLASAKAWGLKMKAEEATLKASGACMDCRGKGERRVRDLAEPTFKLVNKSCATCNGTGKATPQGKGGSQ